MAQGWCIMTEIHGLLQTVDGRAMPPSDALRRLQAIGFPIIPNSRCTLREIEGTLKQLEIHGPAICEHGAVLHTGQDARAVCLSPTQDVAMIRKTLKTLRQQYGWQFRYLEELDDRQVAGLLGCEPRLVTGKRQRLGSEWLIWEDVPQKLGDFQQALAEAGLRLQEEHYGWVVLPEIIQRNTAMEALCGDPQHRKIHILALGNDEADLPMLQAADIPVSIPADNETPAPALQHPNLIVAPAPGLLGWSVVVERWLELVRRSPDA